MSSTPNVLVTRTIVACGSSRNVTRWASENISVPIIGSNLGNLISLSILGGSPSLQVKLYNPAVPSERRRHVAGEIPARANLAHHTTGAPYAEMLVSAVTIASCSIMA